MPGDRLLLAPERGGAAAGARAWHWRRALAAPALAWATAAGAASDPALPSAPDMQFVPPPAGTYSLQRIQASPEGRLIDAYERPRELAALTHGKITLLTFFYTYCTDPLGCPFAYQLMSDLRRRIVSDGGLRRAVRFVSISFDPDHDTPEQLRRYAKGLSGESDFEWEFLTAASMAGLRPVLDSLGQDVRIETDPQGRPLRAINHMLKLFLIDPEGMVREIYALDFLHPAVIYNDIRTLRLEAAARPR
jgi:protein SCO1